MSKSNNLETHHNINNELQRTIPPVKIMSAKNTPEKEYTLLALEKESSSIPVYLKKRIHMNRNHNS